jgi:Protein tyrosine and serine/threonine kinase
MDDLQGMTYLHDSPLKCHGNLCTANCLIDSRWVVKLSDFGLYAFKKGENSSNGCDSNLHNNNLHDNNDHYEEDMMIRRGSTDSKKITVKYESKNEKLVEKTVAEKLSDSC